MTIAAPAMTAPRGTETPARLTSIEGLRALAALWVMFSHLWISQFGMGSHPGVLGLASNWLLYSHLAVDVFIVLSGYCLGLPALRRGELTGGATSFWRRRARRILPPYYFALLLSVGVLLLLQHWGKAPFQIGLPALGVNLVMLQDMMLKDNVFDGPLWSVAVEWRLSLVFPLLIWVLLRCGAGVVLLITAIIGYSLTAVVLWHAPNLLMSCPWYLLLFAMGMCAAVPPHSSPTGRKRRWALGLGASLLLVLLLKVYPVTAHSGVVFGLHMPFIDAVVGVLAALLLLRLSRASQKPLGVLSRPWLVALGRFSYSLYLTHEPLLRVLERLLFSIPGLRAAAPLWKFAVLTGVGAPLIIAYAYLFFLVCERPFLSLHRPLLSHPAPPHSS